MSKDCRSKLPVPLDRWVPLRTRFKIVKSAFREGSYEGQQYRLVIQFPPKYRKGWYPYELQLRDGDSRGLTNYWVNPFGVQEIAHLIEALSLVASQQRLQGMMAQLELTRYKAERFMRRKRIASAKLKPLPRGGNR
jgi:hypothetical protein